MGSYGALWRARFEMMRPHNGAMAALGTLVGLVVAREGPLPDATWIGAPLAAFLVTSFGNAWNDVQDVEVDRKAHPERPLPAGRITMRESRFFAAILAGFGAWMAFAAGGLPTFAFAAANVAALLLYEGWLKRWGLAGNVLVAILVASTFAFGAVAAGRPPGAWGVLWPLMGMAALANLARELLKDLEDAAADAGTRRTVPMQIGAAPTRLLAFLLVNGAVAVSALALLHPPAGWWGPWRWVLVAADALFLLGAALSWLQVGAVQRLLKGAMAAALLAFLAGPLVP